MQFGIRELKTESSEENVILIPYKCCLCESEITLDHISKKKMPRHKNRFAA